MDTLVISPEIQEKATPIANSYQAQIELIREGLAEQVETLLSSLNEPQVSLVALGLGHSMRTRYDVNGVADNYCLTDVIRFKYGWKVEKIGIPFSAPSEQVYIKDLPLCDLMDILMVIEVLL